MLLCMPLVPTVRVNGRKVFDLARQKNTTVAEVARTIGCHPGSIWNMKHGRTVSAKFASRIAGALGVPVSEIEDDEQPEANAA